MGGFHHEALFYSDPGSFIEGTAPFVREGVGAGEPVMVALPEPNAGRLKWALGSAADSVMWVDMLTLGRNPACIIPAWIEFVESQGSQGLPVRGIGEPAWAGRPEDENLECGHHESLLNLAFQDAEAFKLLCPYDESRLPDHVLREARRNHPWVTHEGGCDLYLDPLGRPGPFAGELAPLGAPADAFDFTAVDLSAVRSFVAAQARAAGMDRHRALDLVVAVSELAANSVTHGGGAGLVCTWAHPVTFVCEVRDGGVLSDPLAGRHVPVPGEISGRGLWLVNHLCDLVQIRSGADGTTVRVHMAIDDSAAASGEELPQQEGALVREHPAHDGGTVVESGLAGDVEH